MNIPRLVFAWLIAALCVSPLAHAEPSSLPVEQSSPAQTLSLLRHGGLILYFRHTVTDFGQSDEQMTNYEDCSKQRNLTDQGRDQARAIGKAISALKIPIGTVLASPFCRTLETARLAFGRAQPSVEVRGVASPSDEPYASLRKLLSTPAPSGSNVVLVGHGIPFRNIAGAPHLTEGEAAVIRPKGDDGFEIVARVKAEEWEGLAAGD